jgi:hypothetical protein
MRRPPLIFTAVLGLLILAAASSSSAAPEVRFKVVPLPIPGYPGTGYHLGAGAALEVEYRISGTEYGGFPPPLVGVNFYLPAGSRVHPGGFLTCPDVVLLVEKEPSKCPAGSRAGPQGTVQGIVAFGGTRVPEESTIESFFAPGGGLTFFTFGHSPVSLEIPSTARYENLAGAGGAGPELIAQVPLVETVPGAPDASVERIDVRVGVAMGHGSHTVYYGTVPRTCPKAGFTVRTQLIFAGLGILAPQSVTKQYTAPCPRR